MAGNQLRYFNKAEFNFGAGSELDDLVYGAGRPGARAQKCYEEGLKTPAADVAEWVEFMTGKGIKHVVGLLSATEVDTYETSLVTLLEGKFSSYKNVDIKSQGVQAAVDALEAAVSTGEKAVVHCWAGGGRTGNVLAAWLVHRHGLTPGKAAEAVLATAEKLGTARRVDVETVKSS